MRCHTLIVDTLCIVNLCQIAIEKILDILIINLRCLRKLRIDRYTVTADIAPQRIADFNHHIIPGCLHDRVGLALMYIIQNPTFRRRSIVQRKAVCSYGRVFILNVGFRYLSRISNQDKLSADIALDSICTDQIPGSVIVGYRIKNLNLAVVIQISNNRRSQRRGLSHKKTGSRAD